MVTETRGRIARRYGSGTKVRALAKATLSLALLARYSAANLAFMHPAQPSPPAPPTWEGKTRK